MKDFGPIAALIAFLAIGGFFLMARYDPDFDPFGEKARLDEFKVRQAEHSLGIR